MGALCKFIDYTLSPSYAVSLAQSIFTWRTSIYANKEENIHISLIGLFLKQWTEFQSKKAVLGLEKGKFNEIIVS